MNRFVWVVALFALLVVLLAFGLTRDPSLVPSPLVGKPLPAFSATALASPERVLSQADLQGPALVNVWASWCVACLDEHPLLLALAKDSRFALYGINHKDTREDAASWLRQHGNPYRLSVFDRNGRVGIEFGVYGVPETFVIDREGVIRYKHIGPLRRDMLEAELKPLLEELAGAQTS